MTKKKEQGKLFMAFGKTSESKEAAPIQRYYGIAPVTILAINPTKAELEELYGRDIENEPEYFGTTEVGPEGDKKDTKFADIVFIVRTVAEKTNGIDVISRVRFRLYADIRYNNSGTKVEVINKYGETAWLTVEDAKNKVITDPNMQWFEPADIRPVFRGEAKLTNFLKKYLGIPNKSFKNTRTGEIKEIPNKADAEARLEKVKEYFKGDFSEIKKALKLQPNNKIKVLFGVRTTSDNKLYQDIFTGAFVSNNSTTYTALEKELKSSKEAGSYADTVFHIGDLKEYTLEPTNFDDGGSPFGDDLPFPVEETTPDSSTLEGWFND